MKKGFRFTVEDSTVRDISTLQQGEELIIIDKFDGFQVVEEENNDKIFIYFKDIDRNLKEMNRYYVVDSLQRVDNIKKMYEKYDSISRYKKLLELASLNNSSSYKENEDFFISSNITEREWNQFVSSVA